MVFREKRYFNIGIHFTNKRRMTRIILNNQQNLERYVILQKVLLHFTGIAVQEGILEEKLSHQDFLLSLQCVLNDMPEDPGVLTVPDHKVFNL